LREVSRTVLLLGTRKGLFILESDGDRRDWRVRGPLCESWAIYHAIYDGVSASIYAAGHSEWHGSVVWRSTDLGETWTLSSEGLAYEAESGRKVSKVTSLAVADGRLLVGAEAPGIFASRDAGESWSLLTTLAGQPGSEIWDDPRSQPPGHLGVSALMTDADDPSHFWAIVQGIGLFETGDGGETWTPRNRGLRADFLRPYEEVGFCVHRLVRSPSDPSRMYQQNHLGVYRSDDSGHSWTEITDGLPTEFGFAAAVHPHDRDTFFVIPLDPGHARCMPEGRPAVWRTTDAGEGWQRLDRGLPRYDAHLGVLRAAMAIDVDDTPGLYFGTSTGQVFASLDEGESWAEIAGYLPPVWSVEALRVG
jgi:photosystem II stability/assembly factor-like uncharacterized protein